MAPIKSLALEEGNKRLPLLTQATYRLDIGVLKRLNEAFRKET
jgi:transposase